MDQVHPPKTWSSTPSIKWYWICTGPSTSSHTLELMSRWLTISNSMRPAENHCLGISDMGGKRLAHEIQTQLKLIWNPHFIELLDTETHAIKGGNVGTSWEKKWGMGTARVGSVFCHNVLSSQDTVQWFNTYLICIKPWIPSSVWPNSKEGTKATPSFFLGMVPVLLYSVPL